MMRACSLASALVLFFTGPAAAQPAQGRTYTEALLQQYQQIQGLILKSAEKIGDDLYAFKPTADVRSMGGVLGHVADGNRLLCRAASGEPTDFAAIMKDPSGVQVSEKKTSKPEIIAALSETRALCESLFAKLTDATGQEAVAWFGGQKMPKLAVLALATSHSWEHYGNLVTYMRLKGIVPPSSERQPTGNR